MRLTDDAENPGFKRFGPGDERFPASFLYPAWLSRVIYISHVAGEWCVELDNEISNILLWIGRSDLAVFARNGDVAAQRVVDGSMSMFEYVQHDTRRGYNLRWDKHGVGIGQPAGKTYPNHAVRLEFDHQGIDWNSRGEPVAVGGRAEFLFFNESSDPRHFFYRGSGGPWILWRIRRNPDTRLAEQFPTVLRSFRLLTNR